MDGWTDNAKTMSLRLRRGMIKDIRKYMEAYTVRKVQCLREIQSVKAIQYRHDRISVIKSYHQTHSHSVKQNKRGLITDDLQQTLHKTFECINHAYQLCRIKAKKV